MTRVKADLEIRVQPFKCEFGHVLIGHPTADDQCCGCDYDLAVREGRVADARHQVLQEIRAALDGQDQINLAGINYILDKAGETSEFEGL